MKDEFKEISNIEAGQALLEGKSVYWTNYNTKDSISRTFGKVSNNWSFRDILDGSLPHNGPQRVAFFLELEHNKINDIKVPKPVKPISGKHYWIVTDERGKGYMKIRHEEEFTYKYGVYESEEDVICVSKALEIALRY